MLRTCTAPTRPELPRACASGPALVDKRPVTLLTVFKKKCRTEPVRSHPGLSVVLQFDLLQSDKEVGGDPTWKPELDGPNFIRIKKVDY
jgi:hypothetical protein